MKFISKALEKSAASQVAFEGRGIKAIFWASVGAGWGGGGEKSNEEQLK